MTDLRKPMPPPLRWHHAALAALISCAVAACAPFAKFQAAPLDAGSHASKLLDQRLGGGSWTLRHLTDQAVAGHPDIAVARAKYDSAVAAVRTAGERPNPTIALSPQVVTPISNFLSGTYGVDFDWTIETAGKRGGRLGVAHAQVRAAAANVIDATWKVRSAVRKAFLELYAAQQRAALLNEAVTRQGELLKAMDDRVQAGSESRSVTSQARLLQAQLKLQAAEGAKLAATARAALAEALGMSVAGLNGAAFSFSAFENSTSPAPARNKALTHRADILAALADYAAAEESLRLEIAKQYPDVHLNPGYQLDARENKWAVGIGLTLPLLNHNEGAVGEAEAKRKEAAAMFDSVQAKVLAEADRAMEALKAARVKLAATDSLLKEQDEQAAAAERLINAGSGDRIDLLSARVERAITQASRIDALADIQAAIGDLEAATQTPAAP